MIIRKATKKDEPAIGSIILPVIRDGETYTLDRDLSKKDALDYWLGGSKETFVAEDGNEILGTYYIQPNQAGGGKHVCNCGYMTAISASGRGVATAMCNHSISYARDVGYCAMQFNFVVSTNTGAIRLWKRLGFDEVGRLPEAFRQPDGNYVDALVMYRSL